MSVTRLLSCALLLTLTNCPRVPATVEVEPQPPSQRKNQSSTEAGPSTNFDLNAALAGAEQALLAVDRVRVNAGSPLRDRMDTYLPEEGLRSLYYWAVEAKVPLWSVGGLFGTNVFVDGPHGEAPNYHADHFGSYNPEFVVRVTETARALGRDPARVERTRGAFERQLKRQAQTYLLVYDAIHRDPKWYEQFERTYTEQIGTPDSTFSSYDELNVMNEAFDAVGMSWYESDTAAYFWVRRELDGTAELWREAIVALLTAYGVDTQAEPPALPGGASRGG